MAMLAAVFVPFLGDFLSIFTTSPAVFKLVVFVPFLGDFLSILRQIPELR